MMNKINFFSFILCCLMSGLCNATSILDGMMISGQYDDDNIIDHILCQEYNNETNICIVKLSYNQIKKTVSYNSKICTDLSIRNPEKGEIIWHCGIWGIDYSYYFVWNKNVENWVYVKKIVEELPMDGPNSDVEIKTYKYTKNDKYLTDINEIIEPI